MSNQISYIIRYFHVIDSGIILCLLTFPIRQPNSKILPWFYELFSSSYKQSLLSSIFYLPSANLQFASNHLQREFARYVKRHAFHKIWLGGLNPPKTLSTYAPFGASICNTPCTTIICL